MKNQSNATIKTRVTQLEEETKRIAAHTAKLDKDIMEMRQDLAQCAKKEDIAYLEAKISEGINGILRDALNSVPQRAMATWTIILGGIAILSFVLPLIIKLLHL